MELIKNTRFSTFLKQKEAIFQEADEQHSYILNVSVGQKLVIAAGEKLVVFRLSGYIKEFFESNTIFTKVFTETENTLFSKENIRYFKTVKLNEINHFCREIKDRLRVLAPFEIEMPIENRNGNRVTSPQVKIIANVHYQERLNTFLKTLSDKKMVEYFELESRDHLDVFNDEKIKRSLQIIEVIDLIFD